MAAPLSRRAEVRLSRTRRAESVNGPRNAPLLPGAPGPPCPCTTAPPVGAGLVLVAVCAVVQAYAIMTRDKTTATADGTRSFMNPPADFCYVPRTATSTV